MDVNLADKITLLFNYKGEAVQIGRKHFGLATRGWLLIKDEDLYWSVIRASSRKGNNPDFGPAVAVDIDKLTGQRKIGPGFLTGAWKEAGSLDPVLDAAEAEVIYNDIAQSVDEAMAYNRISLKRDTPQP